jgi:hypothetical protein
MRMSTIVELSPVAYPNEDCTFVPRTVSNAAMHSRSQLGVHSITSGLMQRSILQVASGAKADRVLLRPAGDRSGPRAARHPAASHLFLTRDRIG